MFLQTSDLVAQSVEQHPGQSFSLSLFGPISISRVNAHTVYIGYKN